MTRPLPRLLRIPWRKPGVDVDDELRFHIDMAAADLVARGVPPDAARAEAERRFGAVTRIRDECLTIDERRRRRTAATERMKNLLEDFRHGARALARTPTLTIIGTLTIMLGVGATTAIFSVVNGVLLRPLPYAAADRLVILTDNQGRGGETPLSYEEFQQWRKSGASILDRVGAWWSTSLTLTGVDQPTVIYGVRMSSSVPSILGVKPVLGRVFLADEDRSTGPRAVMLSSDFWKQQFNGDSSIVGKTLQLSGFPFTVVGVYPSIPAARLPNELSRTRGSDYWQAMRLDESLAPRGLHFLSMMARLKPGIPVAVASQRIDFISGQLARDSVTRHRLAAFGLSQRILGPSRPMLAAMFGAVVLVLLVACANVANLLLTRAAGRQREVAIRTALGASRGRIISEVLAESVLRAGLGGAVGVVLAVACLRALRGTAGVELPRLSDVSVDGAALAFALAVSVLTGIMFGLVPALRSANADANVVIREGGRGIAGSLRRDTFRRALIVGELVLSVVLLSGAGLLLRSFHRLSNVPRGFDAERVMTASINLPVGTRYKDSSLQVRFFDDAVERIRALPGVTAAAASSNLPVEGGANGDVTIEGRTYAAGAEPIADKRIVSAGWFRMIGARVLSGREFLPGDLMTTEHVAVINETFASRYFPGENPIGKRVDFSWNTSGMQTIVGVVADVREGSLDAAIAPAIYVPLAQRPAGYMYLLARTSVDEATIVQAMRQAVRSIDAQVPLQSVRSLDDVVTAGIATQRLTARLLESFAAAALLLAAIGLYGVISYSVAQRTQELGIRSALGAQRSELIGGVLREGMAFVAVGVAVGLIAARGAAQLISAQLFGVTPGDPVVYLTVTLLLAGVAVLALLAPAMRAAVTDPIIALRQE